MAASVFADTGNDCSVVIGTGAAEYRAYSFNITESGNAVSARAFVDDPDEEAVVLANQSTDISLNFRLPPAVDVGDEITIVITVDETAYSYNATVMTTVQAGSANGIADFSFTARVSSIYTPTP